MSNNTETAAVEDYSQAIGRSERSHVLIDADRVNALAKTLDLAAKPGRDDDLPPGWHWLFFNPFMRRSELGTDGHPKRGGFLPDVKLPRRMWAGGRLTYHTPIPIGSTATRDSEITNVVVKDGRAGQLVFVTVCHTIFYDGKICLKEEQDIVYREAPSPDAPNPKATPTPEGAEWSEEITPDSTLLFRYSALTSNGHRIHYDQAYAQEEEGYRDLVVHGPLIATLLQGLAVDCCPDKQLHKFGFRGMAPLFVDRGFHIEGSKVENGNELIVWARGPEGEMAMRAEVEFLS